MTTDPIRRSVTVARTPDEAFTLFTTRIAEWWPRDTHARADHDAGEKTEDIVFEPREGGAIYEVLSTGEHGEWGRVTTWDPPSRVAFDWKPNDRDQPSTEVEVVFTALEDGRTRVDLEHRKWELLGPELGAQERAGYEPGWAYVFGECYARAAG
jgi:uncharacterized protein YndB with AHSA1/START domain